MERLAALANTVETEAIVEEYGKLVRYVSMMMLCDKSYDDLVPLPHFLTRKKEREVSD